MRANNDKTTRNVASHAEQSAHAEPPPPSSRRSAPAYQSSPHETPLDSMDDADFAGHVEHNTRAAELAQVFQELQNDFVVGRLKAAAIELRKEGGVLKRLGFGRPGPTIPIVTTVEDTPDGEVQIASLCVTAKGLRLAIHDQDGPPREAEVTPQLLDRYGFNADDIRECLEECDVHVTRFELTGVYPEEQEIIDW